MKLITPPAVCTALVVHGFIVVFCEPYRAWLSPLASGASMLAGLAFGVALPAIFCEHYAVTPGVARSYCEQHSRWYYRGDGCPVCRHYRGDA